MYILNLAINLISISKMDDVGVCTIFEKDTCKMIGGAMVFQRGVQIVILYNLL